MLCDAAALPACGGAFAQSGEATFARQDMRLPLRALMASGELEKATGCKISGRMFRGGGDVIRAMASGDVQRVPSASNLLCTDIVVMDDHRDRCGGLSLRPADARGRTQAGAVDGADVGGAAGGLQAQCMAGGTISAHD